MQTANTAFYRCGVNIRRRGDGSTCGVRPRRVSLAMVMIIAAFVWAAPSANAQSAGDPDDPDLDPGGECLLYTKGNVSVTPHQITLLQMMAQTVTVHWGVQVIIGTPAHPALDASTITVVNAQDATVPEPD